jgi:2'-5' RNA ligase
LERDPIALLVLTYPQLSRSDFDWVQSFRALHDKRHYHFVNPHFTIVFPVFNIERDTFIDHVEKKVQNFGKIDFVLRCSTIVKDSFSEYTDIFLVPDEGFSRIVRLHDTLYTGLLNSELRLDVPFIPHIGIGGYVDPLICKKYSEELNMKHFAVAGQLDHIHVANYENNRVDSIVQFRL